jgi:tetratricopeptide (TPR) repeat protein
MLLWVSAAVAQAPAAAEQLVKAGIACHDKGDYETALKRYDEVLALDSMYKSALAEKAYTLLAMLRYEDAVRYCERVINAYRGDDILLGVYVTYGNALDGLHRTDQALQAYDEGIRQFPAYYQLYYNKGVACYAAQRYEEAIPCLQKAVMLDPDHASAHYALAATLDLQGQWGAALLARLRFLVLEPQGPRAASSLRLLRRQLQERPAANDSPQIATATASPLMDKVALSLSRKQGQWWHCCYKRSFTPDVLYGKLEIVFATLQTEMKTQGARDFYARYYGAYFATLDADGHTRLLSFLLFEAAGNTAAEEWLSRHHAAVARFHQWSAGYTWPSGE